MSEPTEIVQRVTRAMHCSKCGVEASAACDCGAPYMPASMRAAKAIAENPEKSDRQLAKEASTTHPTIAKSLSHRRGAALPERPLHGSVPRQAGRRGRRGRSSGGYGGRSGNHS
jgi:hypothetical protein